MILLVWDCGAFCAGALGDLNAFDALFDGVKTGIEGLESATAPSLAVGLFSVVSFVLGFRILRIFA
jgi:hypothetical protein